MSFASRLRQAREQAGFTQQDLAEAHVLTPQQSTLLAAFDQLNDEGQTKAVEYVEDLVLTGRYKKCPASGLGAKEA